MRIPESSKCVQTMLQAMLLGRIWKSHAGFLRPAAACFHLLGITRLARACEQFITRNNSWSSVREIELNTTPAKNTWLHGWTKWMLLPDIAIQCSDGSVTAHRAILAARVEAWRPLIVGQFADSRGDIRMTDFSTVAMVCMCIHAVCVPHCASELIAGAAKVCVHV